MKSLVITTASVGYLTPAGESISAFYPAVVVGGGFVEKRLYSRELKLLGTLRDDATQAEFDKFWEDSKGDAELAIASFLAAFDEDAEAPAAKPDAPADKIDGEGEGAEGKTDGEGAPVEPVAPPAETKKKK